MYYIPGKNNGETDKKIKPKKRLPVILVAVFVVVLCVVVLFWRTFNFRGPVHGFQSFKNHPHALAKNILENKDFGLPETQPNEEIVRHYAYTLSYSEPDEEAKWVAYTLKNDHLNGQEKRASHFESDPNVPTGSAENEDYRRSGYDKGHLAPAADMKWSEQAMRESFYLSNVCPQDHKFNEGIWAELEKAVRKWTRTDQVTYVVTGPVLPDSKGLKIGKDHVTVPAYFYKVVFSPNPYPKAVGFIIPNVPGKQSFWHYACPLKKVEEVTHLNFFPILPADVAKQIKVEYNINDWISSSTFK